MILDPNARGGLLISELLENKCGHFEPLNLL